MAVLVKCLFCTRSDEHLLFKDSLMRQITFLNTLLRVHCTVCQHSRQKEAAVIYYPIYSVLGLSVLLSFFTLIE